MKRSALGLVFLSLVPAPSGLGATFTNPVVARDCPDPGVVRADDAFYMACTGGALSILRSDDLVRWTETGAAILPSGRAPWSANGARNWAPEIHRVAGRFVAYFTAANAADVLAIGAATSASPTGPWIAADAPLVEEPAPGVIDPTFFRDDDGRQYLFWKRDGNALGQRSVILARELAQDGLSFLAGSSPREVLANDAASWEGGVVEAPWVVRRDGRYYLFYSANHYDERYRTGVARATSPFGPYERRGAPLLASNARFVGPGHGSVVEARGATWFVYHAWASDGAQRLFERGRQVLVDRVDWIDGWPVIGDGTPTFDDQPAP